MEKEDIFVPRYAMAELIPRKGHPAPPRVSPSLISCEMVSGHRSTPSTPRNAKRKDADSEQINVETRSQSDALCSSPSDKAISAQMWQVLDIMSSGGPYGTANVSEIRGCSKSATRSHFSKMLKRGWIRHFDNDAPGPNGGGIAPRYVITCQGMLVVQRARIENAPVNSSRMVAEALADGARKSHEIRQKSGISSRQIVHSAIARLRKKGYVNKGNSPGDWILTPAGRAYVEKQKNAEQENADE